MIIYKKGSLFDAPKESILVHACNGRGTWGAGIAAEFRRRFIQSYEEYRDACVPKARDNCGRAIVTSEGVGCLITSADYGRNVDSPDLILYYTKQAVADLLHFAHTTKERSIHSNKFNSGLFNVPWEDTEKVIEEALTKYPNVTWTVWDL